MTTVSNRLNPVIGERKPVVISGQEFLPKDRDGAVIFIKHKLYHRLMSAKKLKKAEARFLHDLLDIIERS